MSIVAGIEPRDQFETMLASQMAAVHMATMNAARLLKGSTTIPQQDANEKVFNRLTRTFAAQVEALSAIADKGANGLCRARQRRVWRPGHRRPGQSEGGGGRYGTAPQSHAQGARRPALPCQEQEKRITLQRPSGARETRLPYAWRQGGAPEGKAIGSYRHGRRTQSAEASRRLFGSCYAPRGRRYAWPGKSSHSRSSTLQENQFQLPLLLRAIPQ